MDATLFFIVLIPVALSLAAKFLLRWDISWLEFAAQAVVGIVALSLIWAVGSMGKTADREVLNGAVISKAVDRERCYTNMPMPRVCSRSYDCNCYTVCTPTTDGKGNVTGQSCQTYCDTCYRYPWEQDWKVNTNISSPFTISRVDSQGAQEPPRYTRVNIGDPVSVTQRFKNWVKASSGTLFRDADSGLERYADLLPEYPITITDYYHIDRIVTPNVRLKNEKVWNETLSKKLATLGPKREINAVFVFIEGQSGDYAYALRRKWDGFKQNDAVVIIGLQKGALDWVEVMSWSKNPLFDLQMRQAIEAYKGKSISEIAPQEVMDSFERVALASFERRPMEDFEYLKGDIKPPAWLVWTSIIFAILIGGGTSYLFHRYDLDEALFNRRSRSRYSSPFNRYY